MNRHRSALTVVCENRRARHEYEVQESVEAGLALTGSEVKALRGGHGNLAEAYVRFDNGEAWLVDAHISPYAQAGHNNHEAKRPRKLLPQESVGQRGRAGPVVANPASEKREHGHSGRVADGVGGRPLLRHRPEHGVGPPFTGACFACYEGRRAALLPGLLQREGRIAFCPTVAHCDDAVLLAYLRPVEREVEGVDRTDVGPVAVGSHQVLAD